MHRPQTPLAARHAQPGSPASFRSTTPGPPPDWQTAAESPPQTGALFALRIPASQLRLAPSARTAVSTTCRSRTPHSSRWPSVAASSSIRPSCHAASLPFPIHHPASPSTRFQPARSFLSLSRLSSNLHPQPGIATRSAPQLRANRKYSPHPVRGIHSTPPHAAGPSPILSNAAAASCACQSSVLSSRSHAGSAEKHRTSSQKRRRLPVLAVLPYILRFYPRRSLPGVLRSSSNSRSQSPQPRAHIRIPQPTRTILDVRLQVKQRVPAILPMPLPRQLDSSSASPSRL